jgi:site-specific DNA recombinase
VRPRDEKARRFRRSAYLLAGLLRCACGANFDGDGGYYRCHVRCGARAIKQETLEQSVCGLVLDNILTAETLRNLVQEARAQSARRDSSGQDALRRSQQRIQEIAKERDKLLDMVLKAKHTEHLITRLDALEDERIAIEQEIKKPVATGALTTSRIDEGSVLRFISEYRQNVFVGNPETKKAVMRSLIDHAVLDDDELTVIPNYAHITGVKVASPRGAELIPTLIVSRQVMVV